MPPARFIRLKPEEDARLREIEQDAHLRAKVRLRAQVLRVSSRGETELTPDERTVFAYATAASFSMTSSYSAGLR